MAEPISRLSRRQFAGWLGGGAALATLGSLGAEGRPAGALSPWVEGAAGTDLAEPATPPGIIRLNSNENPYGPGPEARQAFQASLALAWRYPDEALDDFAADLAAGHSVAADQVLLGAGSSEILRLCAAAATGPARPLVMADPTFEALGRGARASGAEIVKIPLTPDFRHDLPKMLAARKPTGLLYLCNPNNPTGSITPKGEVRSFLEQVPAETWVLVDEAYFHFVESRDYESVIALVAQHPNLVVARTFSKIYGLAGLRCGYAVAQKATIERLAAQQAFDSLGIPALQTARAALHEEGYVQRCRARLLESRNETMKGLEALGCKCIPSEANFFMADLKQEVKPVIAGMKGRGVAIGRVFPALPTHMRVSVGTREEMARFLAAFKATMGELRTKENFS